MAPQRCTLPCSLDTPVSCIGNGGVGVQGGESCHSFVHVALFCHAVSAFVRADIVRYLASRFPETMAITDNDGRTALHYAATIKDNGHFYNVLSQLGANPKALDKVCRPRFGSGIIYSLRHYEEHALSNSKFNIYRAKCGVLKERPVQWKMEDDL